MCDLSRAHLAIAKIIYDPNDNSYDYLHEIYHPLYQNYTLTQKWGDPHPITVKFISA